MEDRIETVLNGLMLCGQPAWNFGYGWEPLGVSCTGAKIGAEEYYSYVVWMENFSVACGKTGNSCPAVTQSVTFRLPKIIKKKGFRCGFYVLTTRRLALITRSAVV